jgi:dynein heavy chain 1
MKKVAKSPLVIDVLNIPNGQKQLERLADLLTKIQKALGDYLEKERASFPRFYFVGDEDLLEIIGNSRNIARLQKHFRKMFAGVYSLIIDDDQSMIIGVASKEGEEVNNFCLNLIHINVYISESCTCFLTCSSFSCNIGDYYFIGGVMQVRFKTPLLMKDRRINDWLTLVDQEVRVTLASLLAQAVQDAVEFRTLPINSANFLDWVDRYQAQLVVLAAQIVWSEGVERALATVEQSGGSNLAPINDALLLVEGTLNVLADSVLHEQPPVRRKKLEHLVSCF